MKIKCSKNAKNDLHTIFEYFLSDNPEMGLLIIKSLRGNDMILSQHPYIGRTGIINNTREFIVSKYHYTLVYRVNIDSITILKVKHHKQDY